jgi:hypothetical protein
MIYTNKGMLLDKVLCDVILCVSLLMDHGSRPIKALKFLMLLYNRASTEFDYLVFHDNLPGLLKGNGNIFFYFLI